MSRFGRLISIALPGRILLRKPPLVLYTLDVSRKLHSRCILQGGAFSGIGRYEDTNKSKRVRRFSSRSTSPVRVVLNSKCESGKLREDPHQQKVADSLDRLIHDLTLWVVPGQAGSSARVQALEAASAASTPSQVGHGHGFDILGGFFQRVGESFGLLKSSSRERANSGKPSSSSFATDAEAMMAEAGDDSAGLPVGMPRGLYLWGGVGSGKTMLMEAFLESLPAGVRGQRAHFHRFMLDLHEEMHAERQRSMMSQQGAETVGQDPLHRIAVRLASEADVICLDELMVTDIGDAMLLGRLVPALLQAGCVLVTTSNRPPQDLYKNGLSRELFVPCIILLQRALHEERLDGGIDYRMAGEQAGKTWLFPRGADAQDASTSSRQGMGAISRELEAGSSTERQGEMHGRGKGKGQGEGEKEDLLEESWRRMAKGGTEESIELMAQGRKVVCPRVVLGAPAPFTCAWFAFDELCGDGDGTRIGGPMGTADFRAIAGGFGAVFVDGVPVFSQRRRNVLRRFITLVDTLYDEGRALIVRAEAPLDAMLMVENRGIGSEGEDAINDADDIRPAPDVSAHASASAAPSPSPSLHESDEVFAFDRTRSRLVEMGTEAYLRHAQRKAAATLTEKTS